MIDPVRNAENITYSWLNLDDIMATDGEYQDPNGFRYIAYGFYLRNEGYEAVDVGLEISITQLYKNVDDSIRVMVIKTDDMKTTKTIYQKRDNVEGGRYHTYRGDYPETVDFVSNKIICNEMVENFIPKEVIKYTVIIWLEGDDLDCTDKIKEGNIKLQMLYKIIEEIDEEE